MHSVFRNSLNIKLVTNTSPKIGDILHPKALINVGFSFSGLTPNSIILNESYYSTSEGSFKNIKRGSKVKLSSQDDNFIYENSQAITIDLNNADVWDSSIIAKSMILDKHLILNNKLESCLNFAKLQLKDNQRIIGFAEVFKYFQITSKGSNLLLLLDRFEESNWKFIKIQNILNSLHSLDLLKEALLEIVGLGDGLTPSGDDFIIGFFACIYRIYNNNDLNEIEIKKLIEKIIKEGKTTEIAESYYLSCYKSQFSEKIHNLLDYLLSNKSEDIMEPIITSFLNHGSSSGYDTFLGIIFGIVYLLN